MNIVIIKIKVIKNLNWSLKLNSEIFLLMLGSGEQIVVRTPIIIKDAIVK